jgi:hypothetical protein
MVEPSPTCPRHRAATRVAASALDGDDDGDDNDNGDNDGDNDGACGPTRPE